MKRTLLTTVLVLIAACATPHEQASPPSGAASPVDAGPAAPVVKSPAAAAPVTNVATANIGQLQVLVERRPGAELVAVALAIRGGSQSLDATTAGVELLGLRTAATGGTQRLDKNAFSRQLTQLGSTLIVSTKPNYSTLTAKSLLGAWEQTFDLLSEAFLTPAMPASELELKRDEQMSEIQQEQETPDGALRALAQRILFTGTPYANRPVGTESSVKALTATQVQSHLAKLRTQAQLLLVVVGDVDPERVFAKARQAFSGLPTGTAPLPLPAPSTYAAPRMEVESRALPTNYVLASFAGPVRASPEFPAARLTGAALGEREFLEVRTKRNLSYAAGAGLDDARAQSFGRLYVTAVDPATTLPVMEDVVKDLAAKPLSDTELAGIRSTFLTRTLEDQETADAEAATLVAAQLLGGDWRLAKTLPDRIRQVTSADIQAFTKKYARNYQVAVIGDPKKVDLSMLR